MLSNEEKRIANAIIESNDGDGDFEIEDIEVMDGLFAAVSGSIETTSYQEDDYYNGTGAWVTTSAHVSISDFDTYTYNDDGEEIPVPCMYNPGGIERYVEQYLMEG